MIYLILVIVFLEHGAKKNYHQVADVIGKDCSNQLFSSEENIGLSTC